MLATDLKLEKRKYYAGQTKHICRLHLAMWDLWPQERFLVTQGCVPGLILFDIFINDLDKALESMQIKLAVDPKPEGQLGDQLGIRNNHNRLGRGLN